MKADRAAIASARAQIVAQQAAVDNAKVSLGYTAIRSPIDGRTGNLEVKVGNLVTANQTELMTIAQIQPGMSPSPCRQCTCRPSNGTWRKAGCRVPDAAGCRRPATPSGSSTSSTTPST